MNELGTTLGSIFGLLPEVARTQLENSGLIRTQQPPATERPANAITAAFPRWALVGAAVAGVLVLVLLLRRK